MCSHAPYRPTRAKRRRLGRIVCAVTPPDPTAGPLPLGFASGSSLFGAAGIPQDKISFVRDTYVFRYPGAPAEFVAAFQKNYGPTMNAFEAADKNGRAEDLAKELIALVTSQNKSPDAGSTAVPATFLRVTVGV